MKEKQRRYDGKCVDKIERLRKEGKRESREKRRGRKRKREEGEGKGRRKKESDRGRGRKTG